MKKLLAFFMLSLFVVSCGSDDDDDGNYIKYVTPYVFYTDDDMTLTNCISSYKKDGIFIKIKYLGVLNDSNATEVQYIGGYGNDNDIKEIYLFCDYQGKTIRFTAPFVLKIGENNSFKVAKDTPFVEVEDKKDAKQYPQ